LAKTWQFFAICDLHVGIILPQLPESFTFSVSYANLNNCNLNPLGFLNLSNKEKAEGILVVVVT